MSLKHNSYWICPSAAALELGHESQAELTHRVDTRGPEKGQSKHTSSSITSPGYNAERMLRRGCSPQLIGYKALAGFRPNPSTFYLHALTSGSHESLCADLFYLRSCSIRCCSTVCVFQHQRSSSQQRSMVKN